MSKMKRILDCYASDFKTMTKGEKLRAISLSEGRTLVSETVVTAPAFYSGVTNQEIVARFGADLILLNMFDVFNPQIAGIEASTARQHIEEVRALTGRLVGLNLEPVDEDALADDHVMKIPEGRMAVAKTLEELKDCELDFICLTGNPKTGVTNQQINQAIQLTKQILGEDVFIIAGKMHNAGVLDDLLAEKTIEQFIEKGADVILIPSPGTVPGISIEEATKWVKAIHGQGKLVMSAIGTSQEGSQTSIIEQLAIQNKMIGADLHHIGDAGYTGLAIPENITAYSTAIRGKRHTIVRMCQSVTR